MPIEKLWWQWLQVINTNIASLNAQRNPFRTQLQLESALQLLSAGLRVEIAKDGAAWLAIASRMEIHSRYVAIAVDNVNGDIAARGMPIVGFASSL